MNGPTDPPWADPPAVDPPGAAPETAGGGVLAFGVFELDTRVGELRRKGVRVHVQGQPLKLLELLAGSGGRLVTRDEIRDHLWEPQTHVEVDAGINACIRQVRTALGDSASSPRFLETVPRRGYRFLAPVRAVAPALDPASGESSGRASAEPAAPPLKASRPSPWVAVATGALVVGLLLVTGFLLADRWQRPEPPPVSDPERPVLVVLPFENLGGAQGTPDPADDALAAGLTEELIAEVGGRYPRDLAVIARTSAMTYRGTTKTIPEIAGELGAHYVLESSIRSDGQRLRITAQLIDAADQSHLWAETYERPAGDLLDLQREISARIAASIGRELAPRVPRQGTDAPADAYLAYLRGRSAAETKSEEAYEQAEAHFRQALAGAPDFAPAHSALSRILDAYHPSGRPEARAEARLLAARALELDPTLPEAYLARHRLSFYADFDLVSAKEDLDQALALHPDFPQALHQKAGWFSAVGRHREALDAIRRAKELDPLSVAVGSDAALYELFAGHPDDALVEALQSHALDPESYWTRHAIALLLTVPTGTTPGAELADILDRARRPRAWIGAYGVPLHELLGMPEAPFEEMLRRYWEQHLNELTASAQRGSPFPDMEAVPLMALGRPQEALDKLEEIFDVEVGWVHLFLRVHPLFAPLEKDSRFQDVLGRIRWPEGPLPRS